MPKYRRREALINLWHELYACQMFCQARSLKYAASRDIQPAACALSNLPDAAVSSIPVKLHVIDRRRFPAARRNPQELALPVLVSIQTPAQAPLTIGERLFVDAEDSSLRQTGCR